MQDKEQSSSVLVAGSFKFRKSITANQNLLAFVVRRNLCEMSGRIFTIYDSFI